MQISSLGCTSSLNANQQLQTRNVSQKKEFKDYLELSEQSEALRSIVSDYDVENITPRQMAELSSRLYEEGLITFKEHSLLSFQMSLNVEQARNIKAIAHANGRVANIPDPDTPMNFITDWKKRLEWQKQYGTKPESLKQTERIIDILENIREVSKSKTKILGD